LTQVIDIDAIATTSRRFLDHAPDDGT